MAYVPNQLSQTDMGYNVTPVISGNMLIVFKCPKCNISNYSGTLLDTSIASLESSNSYEPLYNLTLSPISQPSQDKLPSTGATSNRKPLCRKKFNIYNINCHSIKNKYSELQAFIESENPDAINGTETWLNSQIKTCEYFPSNYSVFCKDRLDGYGGVLIAVKDLPCQELDDLSSDSKTIWIKISLSTKKHVMLEPSTIQIVRLRH